MTGNKTLWTLVLACWSFSAEPGWGGESEATSEKVRKIEQFTLPDVDGSEVTYEPGKGGVSILVFLAAHQKQSERALKDLEKIVAGLPMRVRSTSMGGLLRAASGIGSKMS